MMRRAAGLALTVAGLATATVGMQAAAAVQGCPAQAPMTFSADYIDTSRAGGEPFIVRHPEGTLLWGSHAGTTHFYSPAAVDPGTAAFVENYVGQTYYYVSEDGESWDYVPRVGPGSGDVAPVAGIPLTGFSDPEFAIDQAGNVFVSEINLANVAVYKSTDAGRSYGLQNVFSFTQSDRQWMAADREDELYMAASGFGGGPFPSEPAGILDHFLAKSTDGGVTFGQPLVIDPIVGDLQLDQDRGILYSLHEEDGTLSIARFPNVRNEDTGFTVEILPIAEGVGLSGVQRLIDPTVELDAAGNLYVVWYDNGTGIREQGVWFTTSTDQGSSWTEPLRVDPDDRADIWPWIAVGDPGHVAIVWLQTDEPAGGALPGESAGAEAPWRVVVAHTANALGCPAPGPDVPPGTPAPAIMLPPSPPTFTVDVATEEPVHTGTICQHGTLCQTDGTDRRLGDYFTVEVGPDGRVHVAVSDTRQGGAVALPLHVRQTGGPLLVGAATPPTDAAPAPAEPESQDERAPLPTTGGGLAIAALGLALLVVRRSSDAR